MSIKIAEFTDSKVFIDRIKAKSIGFHRCFYLTRYYTIFTAAETMDRPDFYH